MKSLRLFSFCIFLGGLLLSTHVLFGQEQILSTDPRFSFKDGVYLSLNDYKTNEPAINFSRFCSKDGSPVADFTLRSTMYYLNDSNQIEPLKEEELFGYAFRGNFYIKVSHRETYFARLVVIGNLSHFVCEVQQTNMDPYYNMSRTTPILIQLVFDYDTGKIQEFNQENFVELLKRDDELYAEYNLLPKKQKKDFLFLFLRKYNDKHPIFFPHKE